MRARGSKETGRCAGENAFRGRQLCEDFAPRNEGIRICGQGEQRGRPDRRRSLRTPARKANEFGFRTQTPGREKEKKRPGRRQSLRTPARKANKIGFRTQTPGSQKEKRRPGRRRSLSTPACKVNKIGFRTQTPEPQKEKRRPGRRRRLRTPACKANEFGFRTQPRAGKKKKAGPGAVGQPGVGRPAVRLPGSDRRRQPPDFHRRRDLCQSHAQYGGIWAEFPGA